MSVEILFRELILCKLYLIAMLSAEVYFFLLIFLKEIKNHIKAWRNVFAETSKKRIDLEITLNDIIVS